MGAPTQIEVSVDRDEYSRYESGKRTITATVVVSGGAPYSSEDVTVELTKARRSRDAVVATSTVTFTSSIDPQETTVEFYLPDIVDQDLINLVRHGKYFVKATSDTNDSVYGESDDFWVSIVTVDRLKDDFLFGVPLDATELLEPKFQPQTITGVTIEDTSPTHPTGPINLSYLYHVDDVTDATAEIGSGANGTVTITADNDLAGEDGNAVVVEVLVPAGTSGLTVSYSAPTLTVSLAVNAGSPVTASNTATLVAAAIDGLADFSAVASGTGADSLSVAEGPTQFSGGSSNTIRQLSWDGGPLVSITKAGTYVLLSGSESCGGPSKRLSTSDDYVVVRVRSPLLLPTQNESETILMTKKTIDEDTLRRYILQAIDWVEQDYLATPVEPTNVVTDRDPTTLQYAAGVNAPAPLFTDTDFDKIVSPLTYFVPRTQGQWVHIQTPWPQLLRVDSLFGAIANTRVIDIDLEWIEHSEQGGLIQLVPFNQEIAFDFVGLLWVNAIRGAAELPNFWHYNAIVGLRDAPAAVQELIAKKAAVDALTTLGQALRPGVGSVSLSRDGVSESVSYINSAKYGVFTGTIQAYKDWIEEEGRHLRAKYRGATMVVV